MPPSDEWVASLAARQHGMVGTRQLLGAGFSRTAIRRRVEAGRLTPYWRGVYRVGPFVQPFGPEMAALLACPGAVLADETAAFVLACAPRPAEVHIISATQRRSREGLVVRRARLAPTEVWEGQGLSLTSPFRTLSDLRGTPVFTKAVWEASYQRLITDDQAQHLLGYRPPTADHDGERHLEDLIRQAGLPAPKTNVKVGRWEVDLYWPDHAVAVELDSKRAHGHGLAARRDERKDADLARRGIDLIRIEGAVLSERPLEAVATIAVALAAAA